MKRYTYKEAYDKIIDAYFKDEIKPYNSKFCFCGTLSPDGLWHFQHHGEYQYNINEYAKMEWGLLKTINEQFAKVGEIPILSNGNCFHPEYEEILFKGMCAALEVLKQIHRERGEVIEEDLPFIKRKLTHA